MTNNNFSEFFTTTGQQGNQFAKSPSVEQNIAKAKSFAGKLQDFIKPELASISASEKDRVARLNAQTPVVPHVKNSILFYGIVGLAVYIGYKILK